MACAFGTGAAIKDAFARSAYETVGREIKGAAVGTAGGPRRTDMLVLAKSGTDVVISGKAGLDYTFLDWLYPRSRPRRVAPIPP